MKKIDVVVVEEEKKIDLDTLYDEYVMYTKTISMAEKRRKEIKELLKDKFVNRDGSGNYWIETSNGNFKNALRITKEIDPIMADPILKRLHIYDKVVTFVPQYDLNVLTNYIKDGTINKEDLNKMFKQKESYALYAVEKAETQEEEIE